eukprot:6208476-Pleurochrysis_carterae.AAC.3
MDTTVRRVLALCRLAAFNCVWARQQSACGFKAPLLEPSGTNSCNDAMQVAVQIQLCLAYVRPVVRLLLYAPRSKM